MLLPVDGVSRDLGKHERGPRNKFTAGFLRALFLHHLPGEGHLPSQASMVVAPGDLMDGPLIAPAPLGNFLMVVTIVDAAVTPEGNIMPRL